MKIQNIKNGLLVMIGLLPLTIKAQVQEPAVLALGAVTPYAIEVTYDKTTHIIFPSGIRYVDLGSNYIIAGKAADADNVLRVKAASKGFEQETNFSVITEDGNFYGFNACYSDAPGILSHNLIKAQRFAERTNAAGIQFEELGKTPASVTGLLMERLFEKDKRAIRSIKSDSYGITFSLMGIYVHDGNYYFHTNIENQTYVPFTVDFIRFRITDRKLAKRTVVQDRILTPLKIYKPLIPVVVNITEKNIFLLNVFTLTEGQVLYIEIFEKNGGRGQVLKIKNSDLVRAQPISKLQLKF